MRPATHGDDTHEWQTSTASAGTDWRRRHRPPAPQRRLGRVRPLQASGASALARAGVGGLYVGVRELQNTRDQVEVEALRVSDSEHLLELVVVEGTVHEAVRTVDQDALIGQPRGHSRG